MGSGNGRGVEAVGGDVGGELVVEALGDDGAQALLLLLGELILLCTIDHYILNIHTLISYYYLLLPHTPLPIRHSFIPSHR